MTRADDGETTGVRRRAVRERPGPERGILSRSVRLSVALGVLLALVACDDESVAGGAVAPDNEMETRVVEFCRAKLVRLDCVCFWEQAAPAFNAGNVAPILSALAERDQYGPMLTRGRLERFVGEEETRRIGRALYDCVDLSK